MDAELIQGDDVPTGEMSGARPARPAPVAPTVTAQALYLKRLVDGAMERWGGIDTLVNSAGHGPRAPILDNSTDEQ